jgi:hypothetical protein
MLHVKKSHYLLITLFTITTQTVICMEPENNKQQNESSEEQERSKKETEANFRERMAQAKEDTYIRDNSIRYRMASTTADHAAKGFMEFCANAASGAVLEVVKRELDIRYDNNPTIGRQLEEIHSGIIILQNAVTLTDDLAKKETALAKYLTANNQLEQKKRELEINNDAEATLKGLRHLRNDYIGQINATRQKRNPNFKPYSAH